MSSKIEKIAQLSMKLGTKHLSDYGSIKSRHDFTQRQLMACLILKAYLKATYRGVVDLLEGHSGLRKVLGMEDKLPHYTTLQKFGARPKVLEVAEAMLAQLGAASLRQEGPQSAVAMDATGLETTNASAHFVSRAGRQRRKFKKLSIAIVCGALLPLAMVIDWGPGNDKTQAFDLLTKTFEAAETAAALPQRLYADAGYDADWIHGVCREVWDVKSWIKPVHHRADGSLGGVYRSQMTASRLEREGYGTRWHVETFFSGLKRMMGSTLASRTNITMTNETAFKVLAYAIHR